MTNGAQPCETCRRVEALDPAERRLAEWAHFNVTVQHHPETAPRQGLVLVTHSPAADSLTGRIELALDGTVVGTLTLTCCPACRVAPLDYVHIVVGYRRLGYGHTLVAAAHVRTTGYRRTAPLPDGPVAQTFRARIPYSRPGASCIHQGRKGTLQGNRTALSPRSHPLSAPCPAQTIPTPRY